MDPPSISSCLPLAASWCRKWSCGLLCFSFLSALLLTALMRLPGAPPALKQEGGEDADRMLSGLTMCNGVLDFSRGGRCLKMILFLMRAPHVLLGDVLNAFLTWVVPVLQLSIPPQFFTSLCTSCVFC